MIGSFFNKVVSAASGTGWVDQQALSEELDSKARALNQKAFEAGKITEEQLQTSNATIAANEVRYQAEVGAGFEEGWEQGVQAEQGFISGALNKLVGAPIRAILGGIPGWLWTIALVGAGLGAFVWLGGPVWLKGKLAKKK